MRLGVGYLSCLDNICVPVVALLCVCMGVLATVVSYMRKTKIISTIGPSSFSEAVVKEMFSAGSTIFRINCSHTSTVDLGTAIDSLRLWAPSAAIMVDIQGPKLRYLGDTMTVSPGDIVTFPTASLNLAVNQVDLKGGDRILIHDGRIEFVVVAVEPGSLTAKALCAGLVTNNKGVNLPDTIYSGEKLSAKDIEDIAVASAKNVEWLAISFVDSSEDILKVRSLAGSRINILSKIERPEAITNLKEICSVSDAVMVARGDLGVELPFYTIPKLQSSVAKVANSYGIPVVCATEMLESMIVSSRPTRAEVSDISSAVRDGFDAVMLSGETAVGKHPALVVEVLAQVASQAEAEHKIETTFANTNPRKAAVVSAAVELAERVSSKFLVALTFTGYSAGMLAACRPLMPIIAVTPDAAAARRLQLYKGISPYVVKRGKDFEESISITLKFLRDSGMLASQDDIVICASRISPRKDADTVWHRREP